MRFFRSTSRGGPAPAPLDAQPIANPRAYCDVGTNVQNRTLQEQIKRKSEKAKIPAGQRRPCPAPAHASIVSVPSLIRSSGQRRWARRSRALRSGARTPCRAATALHEKLCAQAPAFLPRPPFLSIAVTDSPPGYVNSSLPGAQASPAAGKSFPASLQCTTGGVFRRCHGLDLPAFGGDHRLAFETATGDHVDDDRPA
jgi:hypothetical protein